MRNFKSNFSRTIKFAAVINGNLFKIDQLNKDLCCLLDSLKMFFNCKLNGALDIDMEIPLGWFSLIFR